MVKSKSGLAIQLSKLRTFENPKVELEQYPTESEIAAEILWFAGMNDDISEKVIVDLGCGTGVLGIGALLLGAEKVIFVDVDADSLKICRENLFIVDKNLLEKAEFVNKDVKDFDFKADLVIQNPPFGTKQKHADVAFLETAMKTAPVIYSFHKLETRQFIDDYASRNCFKQTHFWTFDWPLKMALSFHRKRIQHIKVGCWRLERLKSDARSLQKSI
jgi:putative methylase